MARRVELVSASLACVFGLTWVVYLVSSMQTLWYTGAWSSGSGQNASQLVSSGGTGLYFAGIVLLLVVIAGGAYLHAVQRLHVGLALLSGGATLFSIALGVYMVEPWRVMPLQPWYLTSVVTQVWLAPVAAAATVCAWVATLAAVPVRRFVPPATEGMKTRAPRVDLNPLQ